MVIDTHFKTCKLGANFYEKVHKCSKLRLCQYMKLIIYREETYWVES